MTNANTKLKIAAVGDLHTRESAAGTLKNMFLEISREADVLLLCGDLTNLGLPSEAEILAAELKDCAVPILAVLGNHDWHSDQTEELKAVLRGADVRFLEDEPFQIGDLGFAGVKGFGGGFAYHMLVGFGEPAVRNFVQESINESQKLESHLQALTARRKAVVLHYAPLMETIAGEPPEIHAMLGSSRLLQAIGSFDDIAAVFHGHSHHGTLQAKTPKGVDVYNCARELLNKKLKKDYLLVEI